VLLAAAIQRTGVAASGPHGNRSAYIDWSDSGLLRLIVEPDELAERDGKSGVLGRLERIEANGILEACDDERKTQRVEPRIKEPEIIRQRQQVSLLLLRYSLKFRLDGIAYRHRILRLLPAEPKIARNSRMVEAIQ